MVSTVNRLSIVWVPSPACMANRCCTSQTHFAASGNVGAVAAKEEVWEVAAQMAGFAVSVAALKALEGAGELVQPPR